MPRWITWLLRRTRFEREMRDELRAHIEHRADDLVNEGLSRDEAVRRARIEFGAVEAWKEQCRDASGFAPLRPFHGAWGDLRLAARRLMATPFFTLFAIVSLALGLGVTTAVYSLLDTLFWRPVPFHQSERLAFITAPAPGNPTLFSQSMSYPDFRDLTASATGAGEFAASARLIQTLVTTNVSEVVSGEAVTGSYFEVLAVRAALGRTIQPADDAGAAAVVVIAHALWTTAFDADPAIVGRVVRLGGQPFEVIGVTPREFGGLTLDPVQKASLWVPLSSSSRFGRMSETMRDRERRMLSVVARTPAGLSLDAVSAEVRAAARSLDRSVPIHQTTMHQDRAGWEMRAAPRDWAARHPAELRPDTPARLAWLVAGVVALVLVVACTNLANLMLARGTARQHEFAVRRALGASRWRLVREASAEGAVIAVIGGGLALAVTQALLVAFSVDIPTARGVLRIDPVVSLGALGLASGALLLSLIVFGLEPALQLTRESVSPSLAAGAGNLSGRSQGRQRSLLRWQVAICTCFFLIAAILGKLVVAEMRHDPGIDLQRLALARVSFVTLGWDEARARRAIDAAVDEARREPALESIAITSGMPFGDTGTPLATVSTPDVPIVTGRTYKSSLLLQASPEIFPTLGARILRGRAFDHRDDASALPVAVISERMAQDVFGTADAIGREISLQVWSRPPTRTFTVVGIAADTDTQHVFSRNANLIYVPLVQQYPEHGVVLVARTAGDPAAAARALQGALHRVDPEFGTMSSGAASVLLAPQLVAARVAGALTVSLGTLTLLLSMVGLFGVQSEVVARRTREVGVRMALGATASQVQRMILAQGIWPVLQGMALGLLIGVVCRFGIRTILDAPIQILDPLAFAIIPMVLLGAGWAACWLPARRAAAVDPNVALRHL
jgi:predicted permease